MVYGQPLAGTDRLGRVLLQNDEVGDPKPNRQVAIFNFLWHEKAPGTYCGNQMMVAIPRQYLSHLSEQLNFEFKWSDNMENDYDPLDWYLNVDVAPGGRFNYKVNL